jgi:hypothetical protein
MGKCKAKKQPHLCALTYRSRMSGTNYSKTDVFSSSTPIRSVACWSSYRATRYRAISTGQCYFKFFLLDRPRPQVINL